MFLSILSFPEIVSKACEISTVTPGGLEVFLVPPAWGDPTDMAALGRMMRSAVAENTRDPADGMSGVEGALTILGAFFAERAPVAYYILPEPSPNRIRALAAAEEYGLVLDIGSERVLLTVLDRQDLIKVADDLCVDHGEDRRIMIQSGKDNVFPAMFDTGELLVSVLEERPVDAVAQ